MGWDYTRVKTDDGCIALMSNDDLVVVDAWETGGGGEGFGGSLAGLDQEALKFRLEYDIDGVKAFVTEDMFSVFGAVSKDILKIIVLVGIFKTLTTTEASIKGISSKIIEGYLNIEGTTKDDLEKIVSIIGIKSKITENFENIVGTKSKEIERFEEVVGQVSKNIELFENVKGIKEVAACLKLDTEGVKKVLSEYECAVQGKKDIKELITILMDME